MGGCKGGSGGSRRRAGCGNERRWSPRRRRNEGSVALLLGRGGPAGAEKVHPAKGELALARRRERRRLNFFSAGQVDEWLLRNLSGGDSEETGVENMARLARLAEGRRKKSISLSKFGDCG